MSKKRSGTLRNKKYNLKVKGKKRMHLRLSTDEEKPN